MSREKDSLHRASLEGPIPAAAFFLRRELNVNMMKQKKRR